MFLRLAPVAPERSDGGTGRVAERLKAPDSKSGVRETVPWVQIPPLPPEPEQLTKTFLAILRFSGLGRVPFSTIEILALGALIW